MSLFLGIPKLKKKFSFSLGDFPLLLSSLLCSSVKSSLLIPCSAFNFSEYSSTLVLHIIYSLTSHCAHHLPLFTEHLYDNYFKSFVSLLISTKLFWGFVLSLCLEHIPVSSFCLNSLYLFL